MPYTLADPLNNMSRHVRYGGTCKAGRIDTAVVPAANATQNSPTNILINAGDMIYLTANSPAGFASLNTAGTNKANTANFVGVAETAYPLREGEGRYITENDPYNPPRVSYRPLGEYRFRRTAGETYATGTVVYLGADAQTVTTVSTNNGTAIGVVAPDQSPLLSRPVVGANITDSDTLASAELSKEVIITIKPALVL